MDAVDGFAEHIAHVDMDAFFVEVERLRRPELRGRPVVVGGAGARSVVASASYEARRHGVRSAMPMVQARRLCPSLVIVPPDGGAYGEASHRVFAILGEFTPMVEAVSIDEAFLDLGGLRKHADSAVAIVTLIRRRIRDEMGLPSSVGLATTKLLAKMASRDAKPDGLFVVASGGELPYLHAKPVRALWGVGEATHARLEELGVVTVGDLAALPRDTLARRLGASLGEHLADLASGVDDRAVTPSAETRSVSVEETFSSDLTDRGAIDRGLLALADRLARRLHREGWAATTVTLKVRYPDFVTVTRSLTGTEPIVTGHEVVGIARRLLRRTEAGGRPVRLLGLAASGLVPAASPRQLGLAGRPWDEVEAAVADVRDRFGDAAVRPARLAEAPGESPRRHGPK